MANTITKEAIYKMKGPELIKVADELGVKVVCNRKKNQLTEPKAALIERILAFMAEAQAEETQEPETAETEVEEIEETSQESTTEETTQKSAKKNNGWEKIAKEQLTNAYNDYTGALENSVSDGEMTQEEIEAEIADSLDYVYHEAITTRHLPGFSGGPAPTEMRFAGKEFCYNFLRTLYAADGYKLNDPKEETPAPTPKRGALIEFNGKAQNICKWGEELGISPNTLYGRIYKLGWSVEKAFTTKGRKYNPDDYE